MDEKLFLAYNEKNKKNKKYYLEMFPMGRRCHHDSCRRMQRVFVEHFDHVLFVSLHNLYVQINM